MSILCLLFLFFALPVPPVRSTTTSLPPPLPPVQSTITSLPPPVQSTTTSLPPPLPPVQSTTTRLPPPRFQGTTSLPAALTSALRVPPVQGKVEICRTDAATTSLPPFSSASSSLKRKKSPPPGRFCVDPDPSRWIGRNPWNSQGPPVPALGPTQNGVGTLSCITLSLVFSFSLVLFL